MSSGKEGSWFHELQRLWESAGGVKLLGIASALIALVTILEARREVLDTWVGDHFGSVLVTGLFVVAMSALGFGLGTASAVLKYRGGSAFFWGVAGMLLNVAAPIGFIVYVIVWSSRG
jgi:hypothetical protein